MLALGRCNGTGRTGLWPVTWNDRTITWSRRQIAGRSRSARALKTTGPDRSTNRCGQNPYIVKSLPFPLLLELQSDSLKSVSIKLQLPDQNWDLYRTKIQQKKWIFTQIPPQDSQVTMRGPVRSPTAGRAEPPLKPVSLGLGQAFIFPARTETTTAVRVRPADRSHEIELHLMTTRPLMNWRIKSRWCPLFHHQTAQLQRVNVKMR